MSNQTCTLTNRDFTTLEFMRARCRGAEDPLAPILKRKIDTARVVFQSDVPAHVATINSRVIFRVNGSASDTRVISKDGSAYPVGISLPVTTARGLALIGLAEGQAFILLNQEGCEERIFLEKVLYQPEAARRKRQGVENPARAKPTLKLVHGSLDIPSMCIAGRQEDFDDPGPSAA